MRNDDIASDIEQRFKRAEVGQLGLNGSQGRRRPQPAGEVTESIDTQEEISEMGKRAKWGTPYFTMAASPSCHAVVVKTIFIVEVSSHITFDLLTFRSI